MSEANDVTVQAACISNYTMSSIFHEYTEGFSDSLAKLRSELAEDGDRVDETLQLELAKLYLSFGMGEEVKSLVHLSNQSKMWELISDLADAISNPDGVSNAFDKYSSCNSDIVFWLVLGSGKNSGVGGKQLLASSSVFLKLPGHLQEVLGPRFAETLMDRGEDELAQTVLRKAADGYELTAQLGMEAPVPYGVSGRAKFEQTQIASKLISKNSQMAPVLLTDYVWREVRAGRKVDIETSELLKSYYNQHRGSDASNDLLEALVLADSSSGRFLNAFNMLVEASVQDVEVSRIFLEQLAEKASDYDFLKYTTLLAKIDRGDIIQESSQASDRMRKLGVINQSQAFLSPDPRMLADTLEAERSMVENIQQFALPDDKAREALAENPLSFGEQLVGQSIELRRAVAQSMEALRLTE